MCLERKFILMNPKLNGNDSSVLVNGYDYSTEENKFVNVVVESMYM